MQASAANDLSLLNDGPVVALLGGRRGGCLPGRAAADDDEIILWLFCRHRYPPLPWPTEQVTQARCPALADVYFCVAERNVCNRSPPRAVTVYSLPADRNFYASNPLSLACSLLMPPKKRGFEEHPSSQSELDL